MDGRLFKDGKRAKGHIFGVKMSQGNVDRLNVKLGQLNATRADLT
jgi:hypothetical protein